MWKATLAIFSKCVLNFATQDSAAGFFARDGCWQEQDGFTLSLLNNTFVIISIKTGLNLDSFDLNEEKG